LLCGNFTGNVSSAINNGIAQTWLISPTKNLWLIFSEIQVQNWSWRMKSTEEGITSRLVLKVEKPRALSVKVR
jgi:hypothetical protein